MYVCMPFSEEVCRSTHGNRHQHALLFPSANHIPSEVVVSSDTSLTLKGLSFSVSVTPLFFICIIFLCSARLHAPGFYNGESTVDIRPKVAPKCINLPSISSVVAQNVLT